MLGFGGGDNNAQAVYLFAMVGGLVFLISLLGWFSWLRNVRKKRIWLAASINPESRQQRWHEDAAAVASLAIIFGIGLVTVLLVIVLWPTPIKPH